MPQYELFDRSRQRVILRFSASSVTKTGPTQYTTDLGTIVNGEVGQTLRDVAGPTVEVF